MSTLSIMVNAYQGLRFEMRGATFEIVYASNGAVRYSACIGGKSHEITEDRFHELQISGVITPLKGTHLAVTTYNATAVMRRHRYVEGVLRALVRPTAKRLLKEKISEIAQEIGDGAPPCIRTVATWISAFRTKGMSGFIDKSPSGNRSMRLSVEVEQVLNESIREQYLRQERRRGDLVHCQLVGVLADRGDIGGAQEVSIPSKRTIQRRIKELDPYVVEKAQRGAVAANKLARAAGRSMRALRILAVVQMDSHRLDVLVVDPSTGEVIGKPWLTCIIDINTRVIVGMHVSMDAPSATTALAALKDMVTRPGRGLPGGICVMIVPDNGVEFANSAFIKVCGFLAITISPAKRREPNDKAQIESFFKTLTYGIIQILPGTTFSNPKARGSYPSEKNACFTLENIRGFIDKWVDTVYHQTIHSRTSRAPIIAWTEQAEAMPPATLSDHDMNALARRPYQRTIQGGRVQYRGLTYFAPALATLRAQGHKDVKILVDELNLHIVFIEHPVERNILVMAESTDPEYTYCLTLATHIATQKLVNEMAECDRKALGTNTNYLARYRLLQQIDTISMAAKKKIRRLRRSPSSTAETHLREADAESVEDMPANTDAKSSQGHISQSLTELPFHHSTDDGNRDHGTWQQPTIIPSFELE